MAVPTKGRESQILTSQAIQEIEQALGDVGRGTDFPMSRSRGNSISSRASVKNMLPPPPTRPPPVPPIPVEHLQLIKAPVTQNVDSLNVLKTRTARSRCLSAPGSAHQPGSLAPIDERIRDHSQMPPPLLTTRETALGVSVAPWLEEVKWHQEVSRQLAQVGSAKPRAPSTTTPAPAKYSLFPPPYSFPVSPAPQPRYVSSTSFTPSDMSRSSSPGWSNEFPQPVQPRDLNPDSPYGYPRPPPFLHNWDTPNISSARHARNSATAHRAGYTGPPIGSRPRLPDPAPISVAVPSSATTTRASSPPSPRTTTTGQFTYYPMMSPYEAETALGAYEKQANKKKQVNKKNGDHPKTRAQMFPLLPQEALFSTEQAAAAVAAAEMRGRDTIFIERGVDLGDFGGILGRRRSSSYYGDDEGGGDEEGDEGGASL